jgi:hypothetical protein
MDNLWNDWWLRQTASNVIQYPLRLVNMWKLHGCVENKCGNCVHLVTKKMGGTYFKCDLSLVTAGPATDWRKSWQACGKFKEINL